jgi:hypothetical protein
MALCRDLYRISVRSVKERGIYGWKFKCVLNLLKLKRYCTYQQVYIKRLYMVITLLLCSLCGSQNKQQILTYISLTDWFLQPKWRVFIARYELSPDITHIGLVLRGLNEVLSCSGDSHRTRACLTTFCAELIYRI